MIENFPVEYTLESGTRVIVNKRAPKIFDFVLTSETKEGDQFTYIDDERPKSEWDEQLNFEQLEALRTFWLMSENVL